MKLALDVQQRSDVTFIVEGKPVMLARYVGKMQRGRVVIPKCGLTSKTDGSPKPPRMWLCRKGKCGIVGVASGYEEAPIALEVDMQSSLLASWQEGPKDQLRGEFRLRLKKHVKKR